MWERHAKVRSAATRSGRSLIAPDGARYRLNGIDAVSVVHARRGLAALPIRGQAISGEVVATNPARRNTARRSPRHFDSGAG
jgi:hypothetical protein